MSKKMESFEHGSEKQLSKLLKSEGNFTSAEIIKIADEKKKVWELVHQAAEFTTSEKSEFINHLKHEIDDTDITAVQNLKREIESKRQEVKKIIDTYTQTINQHRDVFGVDSKRNLDAAQQYIDEFKELPLEQKREWLKKLAGDINERISLYNKAKELLPSKKEYIRTLRRSEIKSLIQEAEESQNKIKECEEIFNRNKNCFSETEQHDLLEEIDDADANTQRLLLKEIGTEIEHRKSVLNTYKKLPAKWQKKYPKFLESGFEQRKESLNGIQSMMMKEYRDLQRNHPLSIHVSDEEKDQAIAYLVNLEKQDTSVPGAPTNSLTSLGSALKMLPSQFTYQKTTVSDPYEKMLSRLSKFVSKEKIENLRIAFYKETYETKAHRLFPMLKAEIDKNLTDQTEQKQLQKDYKNGLQKALQNKTISKTTYDRCLKWWEKQNIEEKRNVVGNFSLLIQSREDLQNKFEKLPKEIKDKNEVFYELSHNKRLKLLAEIQNSNEYKKSSAEKKTILESNEQKQENKQNIVNEKINNKEQSISKLTELATKAERNNEIENAIKYYEQILEKNPNDKFANRNLKQLQSEFRQNSAKNNENNKPENQIGNKDKIKVNVNKVINNNSKIKRKRKRYTMSELIAEDMKQSEAVHGTSTAKNKKADLSDREKTIADDLNKFTGGNYVLEEGKAEKITWINFKGVRDIEEKENNIQDAVVDRLVSSESHRPSKSFQYYDKNNNAISVKRASIELEKRKNELISEIASAATNNNEQDYEIAKKIAAENDLEMNLKAA
ncbi:hypothetical protein GF340_02385 [Candidatus Peregrinibacteria bacterium]|nr:hypothetical protein [Candidatus Peregrinibacteria bacterium]